MMLKILELEGAVERATDGWLRTLRSWTYDEERVQRVTAARRAEQASMVAYASTAGCRMEFLRRQLDDEAAGPCGLCDRRRSWSLDVPLDPPIVTEAAGCPRQRPTQFDPRTPRPRRS